MAKEKGAKDGMQRCNHGHGSQMRRGNQLSPIRLGLNDDWHRQQVFGLHHPRSKRHT